LFSQVQPVFFLNKLDITGNVFMLSNLQHLLIKSKIIRILFDSAYLLFPLLLTFCFYKKSRLTPFLAIATAVFSMIYAYFYSLMIFVSVEVFICWMFIPLIFLSPQLKGFYYRMRVLRIIFITIFFSGAIWKIRAGGIFNIEQMSAVFVTQHATLLTSNSSNFYTRLITWLIDHQKISYSFYLAAFIVEFLFIIGLFTTKFDKYLLLLFCVFVVSDFFLMEINYFTWLSFLGCLYFSKYKIGECYTFSSQTGINHS
jgi:hypothetical protein